MTEDQKQIVAMIRDFVKRDIEPVASEMDHDDIYPAEIVEKMKTLGLFGCIIDEEYGGMGLDYTTYAMIIEEICKGWMSIAGVINSHLIMAYIVQTYGSDDMKRAYLPAMASGEKRGGIALTEPNCGSDVAAIETSAVRDGDDYVINGNKMMITNGEQGTTFAVLAKTDKEVRPGHRGISCFILEKGPGFRSGRHLEKLGYRGIDTSELIFEDFHAPATSLVGDEENQGFYQMMSALEVGRINIAARAVGVATAAFETAIAYAQQRRTMGKPIAEHQSIQIKLADMYTKIEAARLLTYQAAAKKDAGERCDLEAGMAKLFASEMCAEVTMEAMRIHGGYGYFKDYVVERYYRDAPLMIIGEGTSEIQKLVIARNLLKKYKQG
ncbi:MAG: acyl-CoA dehydrogenase family protein [Chloroflexi bacterium]|nr:acyl-CoA dehydrogenase family protein [Chloroflexota bacterium]MCH8283857.1 acyl-CoA dehydrogenase family protein [Chloroflexota bacterium]MCI0768791.1 acyl-CoA dehydrogenase family protein [Chloroflexota bacterium]